MIQQSLLDELSGIIRQGLEERSVPITQAGWVIEWTSEAGWQLTVRLVPGIPLLAAANQLIVFREEEEIRATLAFLPAPPDPGLRNIGAYFSRKDFTAAARAEPESMERRPFEDVRRRRAAVQTREIGRSLVGIKDMGELRTVRESVFAASLKLDPEFFEPVRPDEEAAFRALLTNSVAALTGVLEALDDLIDRMQENV